MAKQTFILSLTILLVLTLTTATRAADESMQTQLQQAQQEIRQLRADLNELKNKNAWQYRNELQGEFRKVPAAANDTVGGVLILHPGWSIKPYGYFKFDMSYDDSAAVGNGGDYIIWVSSENDQTRADDKLSFTARESRFGMKVFAPNIGDIKVMGRVEIGFYNPEFDVENKGTPMLRHAYGEITGSDFSILFGQTSDIISPLVPNTINYTVGWFGGNVGYRHPQLRFTKWFDGADDSRVKIQTALSRQIRQDSGVTGVDDGQDTSVPSVLGRVSYSAPCGNKRMEVGVSGHLGKEEIDWDAAGDDDEVHTFSLNADVTVPVGDKVELKGEFFWAENFDSYFGGIGQGVNTTTHEEIETIGGWFQLGYKPCTDWAIHAGAGMDNPHDEDLATQARRNNYFVFGNVNYYFSKYLSTGLEVTYWRTDYKDLPAGDDFRIQHCWKLSF